MHTEIDGRAVRTRELRTMKLRATGLLATATVLFLVTNYLETRDGLGWTAWIRAAAEAGMVGGLADWFAVTALFRRPLGLPIPHTALIPTKKDQIGAGLANFVSENFLSDAVIREKVRSFDCATKAGELLSDPDHAQKFSRDAAAAILWLLEADDNGSISKVVVDSMSRFLERLDLSTPLGKALHDAVVHGAHVSLFDSVYSNLGTYLVDHESEMKESINRANYLGSIPFLGKKIDDGMYGRIVDFVADCANDPHHDFRAFIDSWLLKIAKELQEKKTMRRRVEKFKDSLINDADFDQWVSEKWSEMKDSLRSQIEDPDGTFVDHVQSLLESLGQKILANPSYQERINDLAEDFVSHIVVNHGEEIAGVITETIAKWDTVTASQEIELQVGKDLQWIRINGTVVGSLAGVGIYALGQLLHF